MLRLRVTPPRKLEGRASADVDEGFPGRRDSLLPVTRSGQGTLRRKGQLQVSIKRLRAEKREELTRAVVVNMSLIDQ